MIAGLLGALVNLVVGILVGGLTIYVGVPLGAGGVTPSVEESFATAAVGAVLAVVVALLLGWIPLLGAVLPAAAWVGVVGHRIDARPPTAVGVGLVAWAIALVMTNGLSVILLGGFQ